jgi:hypothetical protein
MEIQGRGSAFARSRIRVRQLEMPQYEILDLTIIIILPSALPTTARFRAQETTMLAKRSELSQIEACSPTLVSLKNLDLD